MPEPFFNKVTGLILHRDQKGGSVDSVCSLLLNLVLKFINNSFYFPFKLCLSLISFQPYIIWTKHHRCRDVRLI